jgi:hypothetical protein
MADFDEVRAMTNPTLADPIRQDWREKPLARKLFILNHSILFACASMYFGTGWSLILFNFVVAPDLTVDNYYMQFVPQVTAATVFFTYMTMVMMVTAGIMIVAEWKTHFRWVPIIVLLAVFAATGLTIVYILPYNELMREGITDPVILRDTLDKWMTRNRIRVSFWTVQWVSMMVYFALKAYGIHGKR